MSGEECLFCHRQKIGPGWLTNRHQTTIRELDKAVAGNLAAELGLAPSVAREARYRLGHGKDTRLLRKGAAYGKLDLLVVAEKGNPHWDSTVFSNSCAGCHTTGLDSRSGAFVSASIDCFSCHGPVGLGHTRDTAKALFSKRRKMNAREVASICGQCHARNGRSQTTGKPYPFNYTPPGDLFEDFKPGLAAEAIEHTRNIDRHILVNLRDVLAEKNDNLDCSSCHSVHAASNKKHESLDNRDFCYTCHVRGKPKSRVRRFSRGSDTCEVKGIDP